MSGRSEHELEELTAQVTNMAEVLLDSYIKSEIPEKMAELARRMKEAFLNNGFDEETSEAAAISLLAQMGEKQ